jgi:hypothetical protein
MMNDIFLAALLTSENNLRRCTSLYGSNFSPETGTVILDRRKSLMKSPGKWRCTCFYA